MSPQVALLRALRASRVFGMGEVRRLLLENPAYRMHVAAVASDDTVFFLSHRHYLAKGLTPRARALAALHHYEHEVRAFDRGYFDAVYGGRGLTLWRHEMEEGTFEIRLLPGNDVLYEGGVSVVAFFDDVRIAVLSYANVPSEIVVPGDVPVEGEAPFGASTLFVTRKQLTWDHALYQKAFNKAFDRSTPGHFCFAALTGIALAQGLHRVVAIAPEAQPSWTPEYAERFESAYAEFWVSLGGHKASAFGYAIDLPMRLTPLDQLDAKARKRATARRLHIERVQNAAQEVVRARLSAPASTPVPDAVVRADVTPHVDVAVREGRRRAALPR
jgi:hypothetical protein